MRRAFAALVMLPAILSHTDGGLPAELVQLQMHNTNCRRSVSQQLSKLAGRMEGLRQANISEALLLGKDSSTLCHVYRQC